MILLTVGTQLPFDRLVAAVDEVAPMLDQPVFAQIGESALVPRHLEWIARLSPTEFTAKAESASIIVSHAGTGSVLTAQRFDKPIVIFPRRADLSEHRNDHQIAMTNQLEGRPGIYIARDRNQLFSLLRERNELRAPGKTNSSDRVRFVEALRVYLNSFDVSR